MKELLNLEYESILENEEAIEIAKEWHKNFCPSLNKWVMKRPHKGFRWESVKRDAEGEKAFELYLVNQARCYYVMPEAFGNKESIIYQVNIQPYTSKPITAVDCYVFPKNMAWSMSFTHEVGWIGPYFTRHNEYKSLQRKNEKSINAKQYY